MRSALPPLFLLVALLGGCATDPEVGIMASTSTSSYPANVPIDVRIVNASGHSVTPYTCPSRWERKEGGEYVRVEALEVCPAVLISLEPGRSIQVTYEFPANQPPGTWRIVVPVSRGNGPETGDVYTGNFEVTAVAPQ